MDDCDFCRIAAGERSAHVLYADERTIAFLDHQPAVTGHTLVVPRAHVEGVVTVEDEVGAAVFDTVRTVADGLETVLEPDGFSVFHTTGPIVGTIDHAHVHLVPRFTDDDVSLSLPRNRLAEADAESLTADVREALSG